MPHHKIEVFTFECEDCKKLLNEIEIGKCAKCKLINYDVLKQDIEKKIKKYNIKIFPSIIIDGKIKIEGKPKFNFICSNEFYKSLEKDYKIKQ